MPPGLSKEAATPIFFISAVSGEGIDVMLGRVIEMLDTLPKDEPAVEQDSPGVIHT